MVAGDQQRGGLPAIRLESQAAILANRSPSRYDARGALFW